MCGARPIHHCRSPDLPTPSQGVNYNLLETTYFVKVNRTRHCFVQSQPFPFALAPCHTCPMPQSMRVPAFVAAGIGILLSAAARAQLPPGGPWALRFADEFNDTYAGNVTGLDPDKWSPAYPWGRVHNYPAYIRDENIKVNTTG